MSFKAVSEFENEVATFFGAPYGVAVDCCTHGIELVLRMFNVGEIVVPKRTYLSVPFLANKLNINLRWKDEAWEDYYYIDTDKDIAEEELSSTVKSLTSIIEPLMIVFVAGIVAVILIAMYLPMFGMMNTVG